MNAHHEGSSLKYFGLTSVSHCRCAVGAFTWLILSVSLLAQTSERLPWTSSRLVGSPEPPLPFTVERTFPDVELPSPMYLIEEPGSNHLWVVLEGGDHDKPAKIVTFPNKPQAAEAELVFELPGHLIYSVIFDPGYEENGLIYLHSNGPRGNPNRKDHIDRYRVDKKSGFTDKLTIIEWKSSGHNGGDMAFGKDKMLYVTTGDGSNDSDEWNSGQTLDDLLGSVLRIDVRSSRAESPYKIPPDNPFVEMEGARPEIYAYGLRNPWRMGIDHESGQIWVGNNGQDLWETAHLVRPGENYGWSVFEGSYPFYKNRQLGPTPHIAPTIEHHHAEFRSLTGGVVYRGARWPELDGVYVYGDYSTGRIWGAKHDGNALVWHRELADTALMIASFRVIGSELCVVDHAGGIYLLTNKPKPSLETAAFPNHLSETGLFRSTLEHRMAPGVLSYSVNAPGWHDGATARRWMAIPGKETIAFLNGASAGEFPDGTALVQTLERDGLRIETRVQLHQKKEWTGYSYRWAVNQKDAVLVPKGGEDIEGIDWRIPSRTECAACHSRAANYVLGITGQQLDHTDQLNTLADQGLFSKAVPQRRATPMANPYDHTADLHERVGAYLHTNCSICHVESGGGNAKMDLTLRAFPNRAELIEARPQHATFGIDNAMLVHPGAPDSSVLVHRLSHRGPGQMPPLVSRRVDTEAVAMIREWIKSLTPSQEQVQAWSVVDFEDDLEPTIANRSYHAGKKAFDTTGCSQCHQIAGSGGVVGPDLSNVGAMQTPRELLESILLPSRHIKEERHRVPGTHPALSLMPAGMVNVLTKEEVLDLVAYLKSGGRPRVAAIVTEYRHNSHADVIVSRLFQTDTLDGKGEESPLRLASLYTDQVPDSDTSRKLSSQYDFPIYESISEALTLGTGKLAVDGVLLIAEHGNYPKSATGNTQYPKRRFWEEIVKVFKQSDQVVPVFIDKHLADNWIDAKFLYDSAQEMEIPIMAGSSLPTTWRRPAVDMRRRARLKEMVTLTYGSTDAYGFHALELAQALAERRGRGEVGIQAVQALEGEAVWRAFEEGRFDLALFQSAWERLENPRSSHDLEALRKVVARPLLFTLECADGWKSHFLELNGAVGEWAAAWRYSNDDRIESSLFWTQEGRPAMHFTWLLKGIEKMILTGEPSWSAERTLITSGALDALLNSLLDGGERLETPYLEDIRYRSRWRWAEPPPPPPMRPWSGQ